MVVLEHTEWMGSLGHSWVVLRTQRLDLRLVDKLEEVQLLLMEQQMDYYIRAQELRVHYKQVLKALVGYMKELQVLAGCMQGPQDLEIRTLELMERGDYSLGQQALVLRKQEQLQVLELLLQVVPEEVYMFLAIWLEHHPFSQDTINLPVKQLG